MGVTVSAGAVKVSLGVNMTVGKSKDVTTTIDGSKLHQKPGGNMSPIHRDNVADLY